MTLVAHRFLDAVISFEESAPILFQPFVETPAGSRIRGDLLRRSETFGMVFQPLDAEQLAPNQLRGIRRDDRRETLHNSAGTAALLDARRIHRPMLDKVVEKRLTAPARTGCDSSSP